MKIFERRKCRKCPHFEWEDEIPDCTFGIDDVQDIDDFMPFSIHEKNTICSHPTIEIQIKFNGPYDYTDFLENIAWLCPENIRLILREKCSNTRFEVKYSKRFERKLRKLQKRFVKVIP